MQNPRNSKKYLNESSEPLINRPMQRSKWNRFGCLLAIVAILIIAPILSWNIHNPTFRHKSYLPISLPAKEFSTLEQGFRLSSHEPFIVRNPVEFRNLTEAYARKRIRDQSFEVRGYDEDNNQVTVKLIDMIHDWDNSQLKITVFDSPTQIVELPESFVKIHYSGADDRDHEGVDLAQSMIFSPLNAFTAAHMDPINYGGGWMYLWQGEKDWDFLPPEYAPLIFDKENNWLNDVSNEEFVELLYTLDNRNDVTNIQDILKLQDEKIQKLYPPGFSLDKLSYARFLTVKAKPFDFVYFPPAWIHRVKTHGKGLGVGGYMRPKVCLQQISQIQKLFDYSGVMSYWN